MAAMVVIPQINRHSQDQHCSSVQVRHEDLAACITVFDARFLISPKLPWKSLRTTSTSFSRNAPRSSESSKPGNDRIPILKANDYVNHGVLDVDYLPNSFPLRNQWGNALGGKGYINL